MTNKNINIETAQKSHPDWESILENMPAGLIVFNRKWEIIYNNDNVFRFGIIDVNTFPELLNLDLYENNIFFPETICPELLELQKGIGFEKELKQLKSPKGKSITISLKGSPIYNNDKFDGGVILIEDQQTEIFIKHEDELKSDLLNKFLGNLSETYCIIDNYNIVLSHTNKNENLKGILSLESDKNFVDCFRDDIKSKITILLDSVRLGNKYETINISTENKGENYIIEISVVPFKSENGKNNLFIALIKDITSTSNEFLNSEEIVELKKYFTITSKIVDAVIHVDENGFIQLWNESAVKLFGYNRSQVHGQFIGKVISAFNEKYFASVKASVLEHKTWNSDFQIQLANGEKKFLSFRVGLIEEEDARSFVMLCSNVTERKRIEHQLRNSEERFRNIVTNTKEYICTLSIDGNINYINPSFSSTFEYEDNTLIKSAFRNLVDHDFFRNYQLNFDDIIKKGTTTLELPMQNKDGEKIFVLASFSTVLNFRKQPKYLNAILTDITEKKKIENDLLLIRSLFEVSRDGIFVVNNRELVLANEAFVEMFGYDSLKEVIGKDPLDFVSEKDIHKIAHRIEAHEKGEVLKNLYEFKGKKKDGSEILIENSETTYKTDNNLFIVSLFRDITEQKKYQENLRESEGRFRSITDNITEFIWTAEKAGKLYKQVFYSSPVKNITGFSADELIKDQKLWLRIIHPNDYKMVLKKIFRFFKDKTHNSDEIEYRIIKKNGDIVWIENKITVERNEENQVEKMFGLVSDITLNKKAEEDIKKTAASLKELNETKDRFISIISHDLRTPFSSILGFTDILLSDSNLDEKQSEYVTFIQESSKNMLSLVNSLLDWTRLQTGRIRFEPQRMNSRILAGKIVQMLSGSAIQKMINLESKISEDIFIHADENLLLQVFTNLIANAIKFTSEGGNITISSQINIDSKEVLFVVEDDGVGIDDKDIDKLFKVDTKFTTKGTSGESGSGLGLSLCYDIVKKHGGKIWVESEKGNGTQFKFTIPISSTNILLVDDKKTDRILYSKIINSIQPKYTVIEASNAEDAFDTIFTSQPSLVITDHYMPESSGYELVKKIQLSDDSYKPQIIVLSDDLNEDLIEDYKELGVEHIFSKPVNLKFFKTAIDKSLKQAIYSA
ncbi:MAG: PAS domain S-box protein [Melioribacteraceae bacterium]|nr:PAS domain S-box protein [Melioribacteraceae bacterium]